jgi:hypothetical protein
MSEMGQTLPGRNGSQPSHVRCAQIADVLLQSSETTLCARTCHSGRCSNALQRALAGGKAVANEASSSVECAEFPVQ